VLFTCRRCRATKPDEDDKKEQQQQQQQQQQQRQQQPAGNMLPVYKNLAFCYLPTSAK